ncbi:MAG TPA: 2OG-Fe(II) oxygenase [Polyangia bacterium]|nr:2OG-Fe(II) oxygenase [Polyangia bacterium]
MSADEESDWRPAALALAEHGYFVSPGAMAKEGWQRLRGEAEQLLADDAFFAARVGRGDGDGALQESAVRGGSLCWLDASMPGGQTFMRWMDGLRRSLNRELFLGLDSFEAHYAHYPVGASYGTHVDRHRHSNARVVSAVIYLNAEWPADAGGELVIYDAHERPRLTLSPEGGTLVLFMSAETPHEAKKATRERWSIAGWFRTRP